MNKATFLSLNILERPSLCRSLALEQLHPESPIAIKKNLGLDRLDKELFPTLVTGVRWWPFLTLALDCTTERAFQRVFKASRTLKADLGRKSTARMGPETKASVRPYLSMVRNLREQELHDPACKALLNFFEHRAFDGSTGFFVNYRKEQRWQSLFEAANGKPATAYIKAYRCVEKRTDNPAALDNVITEILQHAPDHYDALLWHGAFAFALVRCLFGRFDLDDEVAKGPDKMLEWKSLLANIIQQAPHALPDGAKNPRYLELLSRIEDEDSPPPLASQTKQFRIDGRPVLASLRIPLFHRLYFRPTPGQR